MDDFREEEALGKAYDARLMARLLTYAKPFWRVILLCIMLLGFIAAVELARPYLLKVAIDDHLNGISKPMLAYPAGQAPAGQGQVYSFAGRDFVRLPYSSSTAAGRDARPGVTAAPALPGGAEPYQVLVVGTDKILVRGHVPQGSEFAPAAAVPGTDPDPLITSLAAGRRLATVQVTPPGQAPFRVQGVVLNQEDANLFQVGDGPSVLRLAVFYLVLLLLGLVLNYGQTLLLQLTGQRIVFRIRQEVFSHLQRLPLAFFDRNPVGRLVTRVANDTEALSEMYTSVLVNLFRDVFLLVGITAVMLRMNMKLGLLALAVMPLVALVTFVYQQKARDAFRDVRVKLARINATLSENISGMRVVQIFRREKAQAEEFHSINQAHFDAGMRQLYVFAVFRPALDLLAQLALTLVIWYGGGQVIRGNLQFGVLIAFTSYIQQFFRPIQELAEKFNILQQAMASSERLFQLLDTEPEVADKPEARVLDKVRGAVEFDHVWFAYEGDNYVLRDVSFKVEPGQTVAFVGHTGAGKSSIMNLVSRFYDVQRGAVRVDGVDVRDVTQESLRRNIAVVMQDVFLFTGDVKGNIRLNADHITNDDVRRAAATVGADSFIRRLPHGYDEPVAERGATLSAGERQLLAFARALAFDPAILVLDEATASIDSETEHLIQQALRELSRGRTTLIVAHRLSTIQHADQIIVLHKGMIREQGTHQELLARQGLYYKLWRLQFEEAPAPARAQGSLIPEPATGD